MPELPDVECFRCYLASTALHKTIRRVEVTDTRVLDGSADKDLRETLEGARLHRPWRQGKWLFARVAGDGHLAMHFGMTGRLEYFRADGIPRHARVLLWLQGGWCLAYVCPRMFGRVVPVKDVEGFLAERRVGPDAMEVDREEFSRQFGSRRGAVKGTFMNQSVVAGLGNIYADETLFQAGVHPKAQPSRLSDKRMGRLYSVMRRVLRTAIQRGADARDMPRSWLIHSRDVGGECPRCGGRVRRVSIAQRSTYYCPNCQR
ncbi:MAG: Fpg/Nei family DNA glycosylase [Phycisphaerae bacterium]